MKTKENTLIEQYKHDEQKQEKLYKKTLFIVVLSQIFGGAGLAAGITVGALLAKDMLGTDSYAGLPVGLFTLGSAGAALIVGRLSQRYGRRFGLSFGFISGGLGALGIVLAAVLNNIWLLFIFLLIYGAGTATNLQARYAGTDLAKDTQRATAVSIAMVSTTFGAVAGPNLVDVMGDFAVSIGVPALSGPFILAGVAYIFAGLILFGFLRPDPLLLSQAIVRKDEESNVKGDTHQSKTVRTLKHGVALGTIIMVTSQLVMVAIMTMTPVHMGDHGHSLGAIGMVIGVHIGAMYLPSLVTGILVDKIGRVIMAVASGVTLLFAGILPAVAPSDSLPVLIMSLALLGLGWNFGVISGTALIVDATTPVTRAKTQGKADVFIALSGASGGAISGMVVAGASFISLSVIGGILALLLVPLVFWVKWKN
ncbi:MFS transporter [Saliterribacillus persicus]|uniref:Putative MFS family arabinose efflux permease n=1 Tax=Saliterribacillus persicus TaxID=930114 RepID=A0A368Y6G3_9BACI|nr:MFS transporter [Saliterribacillus persicus]RCW74916.1 putative MFS family arabinose efflux permease [Saliterribacillus persicus]